jgi:hypothetical protein
MPLWEPANLPARAARTIARRWLVTLTISARWITSQHGASNGLFGRGRRPRHRSSGWETRTPPTSRSTVCSQPRCSGDLRFLATPRDRWCPLRSRGRGSGVYPAVPPGSGTVWSRTPSALRSSATRDRSAGRRPASFSLAGEGGNPGRAAGDRMVELRRAASPPASDASVRSIHGSGPARQRQPTRRT